MPSRSILNRALIVTAFAASAVVLFSGVSSADLVEPTLPERHEVKRPIRAVITKPAVLENTDLPNRKGVEASILKIHTAGRVGEQFDSNIFLDNTDTEPDFITMLSPSVGFEMKAGDTRLSGDYELDQYLFGTWHDQNHHDHRVRAMGETMLTNYKISVRDEFRIFIDRASNENSLRLKENTNFFKAGVSTLFDKINFEVGYMNQIQFYDSGDLDFGQLTYKQRSWDDQAVYVTASYRFRPKTYLILENDLGHFNYFETSQYPDSYYDDILAGIRGEWTSKIVLNLLAGVRYQHYDHSDVISDKPFIGPIIRGGFQYNPTKRDKFVVSLERTDYESTYNINNHYTANLAGVDYKHKFTEKISCGLFGSYQLHTYPCQTTENGTTAKRYDNFLDGGASVRYDMNKYLSAELKYEYRQRMSIFDTFDYKDNLVTIRGTAGF